MLNLLLLIKFLNTPAWSCIDSELMTALDALIEYSLSLIGTSHLPGHVVHLFGVTLGALLVHNDFFNTLIGLGSLLSCLHPLLSLVELLSRHNLVA